MTACPLISDRSQEFVMFSTDCMVILRAHQLHSYLNIILTKVIGYIFRGSGLLDCDRLCRAVCVLFCFVVLNRNL